MVVAGVYDGLAATWDKEAGRVYRPLARALVAASPVPLAGRLVLDVGTGTGAVARAVAGRGARVVGADSSLGMVAYGRGRHWPAVASDVLALPFPEGTFDAALAGFLLNHLPPVPTLAEMARAVRPGGAVLGSTWAAHPDPVKAAIDAVLLRWGWVPPAWYRAIKEEIEPVSGYPSSLAEAAREAGLVEVGASVQHPDLAVRGPRTLVAYRVAVPHIAPWLAALGGRARDEVTSQALAAVRHIGQWRPAVVILTGRVAAQRSGPAARSRALA